MVKQSCGMGSFAFKGRFIVSKFKIFWFQSADCYFNFIQFALKACGIRFEIGYDTRIHHLTTVTLVGTAALD